MKKLLKSEGFILKKRQLLGKDYAVTVFTKELGKISVIAKGARSITSRRAAHLQTGNLVTLDLHETHGTSYVQGSTLISGFLLIRTQEKLDYLYLLLYILDKMLAEGLVEPEIYLLTKKFFILLSKDDKKPKDVFHQTLQQLLMNLGYIDEELSIEELFKAVEKNIEEKLPQHVIM